MTKLHPRSARVSIWELLVPHVSCSTRAYSPHIMPCIQCHLVYHEVHITRKFRQVRHLHNEGNEVQG
jgi:hypothetical protein